MSPHHRSFSVAMAAASLCDDLRRERGESFSQLPLPVWLQEFPAPNLVCQLADESWPLCQAQVERFCYSRFYLWTFEAGIRPSFSIEIHGGNSQGERRDKTSLSIKDKERSRRRTSKYIDRVELNSV